MSSQIVTINSVASIKATAEAGVFWVEHNFTIKDPTFGDITSDGVYGCRPEDNAPHNLKLIEWMAAHPQFPVTPYTPPSGPTRDQMQPLTARRLRLGLVNNGKSPSQVDAAIAAMPEGVEKEKAKIEWQYASQYERLHPLIVTIGASLSLTPEQIDEMWMASANL